MAANPRNEIRVTTKSPWRLEVSQDRRHKDSLLQPQESTLCANFGSKQVRQLADTKKPCSFLDHSTHEIILLTFTHIQNRSVACGEQVFGSQKVGHPHPATTVGAILHHVANVDHPAAATRNQALNVIALLTGSVLPIEVVEGHPPDRGGMLDLTGLREMSCTQGGLSRKLSVWTAIRSQ